MDAFETVDTPRFRRRRRSSPFIWNVLTGIVLLMCMCVGLVYLMIFMNPYSSFNIFPPNTQFPIPDFSTPTITKTYLIQLPDTWTPTSSPEPTSTRTPVPSVTPISTNTPPPQPTTQVPTAGPSETPGAFAFAVQQGSPQAIPNIYHQDAGCNWSGVAGQVTTLNGSPVTGLIVQLGGNLEGNIFDTRLSLTGVVREYGPSGYEIQIADKLVESNNTLYIQLLEPATNLPVSDKIYFTTYNDCEKNLILINFIKRK